MAHHRNKRSSSKAENKRIEHKKVRRATDAVLDGSPARVVRGFDYSIPKMQPPLLDVGLPAKKKRGKPRPKKERCPVNRTHEWYRETITEVGHWFDWGYGWWFNRHLDAEGQKRAIKTYRQDTCIHCWKTRSKTLDYRYERR